MYSDDLHFFGFKDLTDWDHFRTGSSVICDPPVLDTDIDYVVVYNTHVHLHLKKLGYTSNEEEAIGMNYENSSVMMCYRKENINIIAVKDAQCFERWRQFTNLAQLLNLKEKAHRKALCQFLTEGTVRATGITNPDFNG